MRTSDKLITAASILTFVGLGGAIMVRFRTTASLWVVMLLVGIGVLGMFLFLFSQAAALDEQLGDTGNQTGEQTKEKENIK